MDSITTTNNHLSVSQLAELQERFIAYCDTRPQTIATYQASLRHMFGYFRDNNICNPTTADILRYKSFLLEHFAPATVSLRLTSCRLFFAWLSREGIYPNIADNVKGAKASKGFKKDYLTSNQVQDVLGNIPRESEQGKRDFAILALMITCGLRCIEVQRANIEDMRTAGNGTALFIQGKGEDDKGEYVKLPASVERAIRQYLVLRGKTKATAPLFASCSNRNNGRLTTRSISRLAKDRMVTAGYDSSRLTAHSLRHTTATLNLLNGGTEAETQQLLRHKNINTTMIYSHALERAKNNSEARIAGAIGL